MRRHGGSGLDAAPRSLGGATVLLWTSIGGIGQPVPVGTKWLALLGSVSRLAICQSQEKKNYFLFSCDSDWQVLTDTRRETVDAAKRQAELEYAGVSSTWEPPAWR
jgi:hypothetical protein